MPRYSRYSRYPDWPHSVWKQWNNFSLNFITIVTKYFLLSLCVSVFFWASEFATGNLVLFSVRRGAGTECSYCYHSCGSGSNSRILSSVHCHWLFLFSGGEPGVWAGFQVGGGTGGWAVNAERGERDGAGGATNGKAGGWVEGRSGGGTGVEAGVESAGKCQEVEQEVGQEVDRNVGLQERRMEGKGTKITTWKRRDTGVFLTFTDTMLQSFLSNQVTSAIFLHIVVFQFRDFFRNVLLLPNIYFWSNWTPLVPNISRLDL